MFQKFPDFPKLIVLIKTVMTSTNGTGMSYKKIQTSRKYPGVAKKSIRTSQNCLDRFSQDNFGKTDIFQRPDTFGTSGCFCGRPIYFGKSGYFLNVRIFFLTPGSFLSRPFWEVRILFERPDLFVGLRDRFLGHKFHLTNTKIRK